MAPPPLPPSDTDRFLQTLRRSKLLSTDRLEALVARIPPNERKSVDQTAEFFVQQQALTHFQVAKLKQGTWQGLVLGPYHILSPLGKGGMGAVYLAHDTRKAGAPSKGDGGKGDPSLVALKILPPKRAKEEDRTLARFLREMDMCRRVDHPHLTKTYEVGDINGVYYIAMEYIRGQSLKQYVVSHGPLLVPRVARLFSEIADGLMHAHERGLIHRDLKPSNVMVTPNGHAKILDLGLALAVDEELPADKKIVGGQGYVVGTMDYIAPEQVDSPTGVDPRADLYALGCSMYFALTGSPPFPGGTSIEKMKRHRTEFPDPVSYGNPTVDVEFSRIVEKLMEKKPDHRFRDA
jgi:serine/threonine protein kinase